MPTNLIVYGILALAVLASVGGLYVKVHGDGERQGEAVVQGKWDAANQKAQEKASADRLARAAAAKTASEGLLAAQGETEAYRAKWAAERAKRPVLASCAPAKPADKPLAVAGSAPEQPAAGDGMQLRLTYAFVRLWDAAWTGTDGKPVFGDPGGSAGEAVTPDTALDNHAENAARCSATSGRLNRLIDLIRKLQK